MTRLSVNINKIATLRNSRGENIPDVTKAAVDCQKFGAEGITVHPRPDGRHIRQADVINMRPLLSVEFNIEGNPTKDFIRIVDEVKPEQVTLVPDSVNVLTSNAGWNTVKHHDFLSEVCAHFKEQGIRTSIFIEPVQAMVEGAKSCGADRIELYTAEYAKNFPINRAKAIAPYLIAANKAKEYGLGINAGHDLNLENLEYFVNTIKIIDEVSIGHSLICDALYSGLENTIKNYLSKLKIK